MNVNISIEQVEINQKFIYYIHHINKQYLKTTDNSVIIKKPSNSCFDRNWSIWIASWINNIRKYIWIHTAPVAQLWLLYIYFRGGRIVLFVVSEALRPGSGIWILMIITHPLLLWIMAGIKYLTECLPREILIHLWIHNGDT